MNFTDSISKNYAFLAGELIMDYYFQILYFNNFRIFCYVYGLNLNNYLKLHQKDIKFIQQILDNFI